HGQMKHMPGYLPTDRTRYRLQVSYCPVGSLAFSSCASTAPQERFADLEQVQVSFINMRENMAIAGWRTLSGMIFDEQGQHVANICARGAIWNTGAPHPARKPLAPPPALPEVKFLVSLQATIKVSGEDADHAKARLVNFFNGKDRDFGPLPCGDQLTGDVVIVGIDLAKGDGETVIHVHEIA
ncbi:MAG: hypothetical protein KAI82_17730, partial [Tritonibacter mobilis]|nr:hypothetical protein [Tritonibacter mobilis]